MSFWAVSIYKRNVPKIFAEKGRKRKDSWQIGDNIEGIGRSYQIMCRNALELCMFYSHKEYIETRL